MHIYSYDGCDTDLPGSDQVPRPDSGASRRSLVILLDDDDDEDEFEQQTHPPSSHRPKRPLPRRFGRKHHSPVKEATIQGTEMSLPEVDHTISCTPGLRDKSMEVRLSLRPPVGHPKFRRRNSATSPRGNLQSKSAAEWVGTLPGFYLGVSQKGTRHPKPVR